MQLTSIHMPIHGAPSEGALACNATHKPGACSSVLPAVMEGQSHAQRLTPSVGYQEETPFPSTLFGCEHEPLQSSLQIAEHLTDRRDEH